MRRSAVVVCSVALSAAVTSCSAPAATDTGAAGKASKSGYLARSDASLKGSGPLTVQLDYDSVEAGGLDPQTAATARSWSIESLVYEPLVTVDAKFGIKPLLASSWKQPDATTYVFTLRKGVTFSNGRALTAADVVGSIKRLLKSKAAYAAQLGPVKSVRATGADEVTVELSKAYTPFLAALANTPAAILPMKEIEDGSLDPQKEMLGTGPFVVKDHKQDQYWNFTPNTAYRDAKSVRITDLKVEIVPQEAARLAALRNGTAGLVNFNNVDSMDQLTGTRNAEVVSQTNSDFYYLIQNSKNPDSPLADEKVRFALDSALNREEIASVALGGQSQPTGVTPSVLPGACDPAKLPAETGDTAPLKNVGTLRLAVYTSEPAVGQIAQVIQQQLAEAGVTVKIQKYDDTTYGAKVFGAEPDFDLAVGWFAGYVDASMVSRWWNPVLAGFSGTFLNDDKTLDALIDRAASEPDGAARTKTLAALCARVDTAAQMLPLVTRPSVVGYRTDQVSPTLRTAEGYGNFLRDITSYTLPGAK
ncbi:ABC transporter substrate-binding protein [Streptomyces sp. S3(2020)]|uniref:ABC transporter substrate-binding protein n=1 Tax=Streptomyces sp. S3(2020) TaxID=2732044 RepID=UPI001489A6D4|nr:ABC transporter substrate-binding protein [Streptomyces sp. S3(2020)]NNN35632.1 ABC transporter substrate-binding protein [Streptomyces sp. S3(2020)]